MSILLVSCVKVDGIRSRFVSSVTAVDGAGEPCSLPIPLLIDTGADITCFPRSSLFSDVGCVGRSILTRGHTGNVERSATRIITLALPTLGGTIFVTPPCGILVTGSPTGLLGMDILGNCDMLKVGDEMVIEYRGLACSHD